MYIARCISICWNHHLRHLIWSSGSSQLFRVLRYVILKSCCQFVNRMEVRILPKYEPNEAEVKDTEVYADNVRGSLSFRG